MKENNPDPADQGRRLTIQWTANLSQRPGHGQDQTQRNVGDRYQRASAAAAGLRASGTEVSSASKSPDPRAVVPVRKSALATSSSILTRTARVDAVPVGAEPAHVTAVHRVSTAGYRATADRAPPGHTAIPQRL